jgi:hypothetical protein
MTDTPAEIPIHQMTPDQATARLAEMAAAYRPAPSATPQTAQEAAARLDALAKDKDFYARLMAGDAATKREFAELTALKAGAAPGDTLPGEPYAIEVVDAVSDPNAVNRATYNGLIEALREQGLPASAEQYVRDLDSGKRTDRPTQGDGAACRQALDRLMKNPEFVNDAAAGHGDAHK